MLGTVNAWKKLPSCLKEVTLEAYMTTDGENPGVLTLHAPEGTILTTHELDCTLKVLGPIPHLAGLEVELDFLSNSAQSASSHTFHYTAVKVHSH